MVTWKEFAAAEPDLAEVGRSLLCHLFVLITPTSPKRHDRLRERTGDHSIALP